MDFAEILKLPFFGFVCFVLNVVTPPMVVFDDWSVVTSLPVVVASRHALVRPPSVARLLLRRPFVISFPLNHTATLSK